MSTTRTFLWSSRSYNLSAGRYKPSASSTMTTKTVQACGSMAPHSIRSSEYRAAGTLRTRCPQTISLRPFLLVSRMVMGGPKVAERNESGGPVDPQLRDMSLESWAKTVLHRHGGHLPSTDWTGSETRPGGASSETTGTRAGSSSGTPCQNHPCK